MNWFYDKNGTPTGPVSEDALAGLFRSGSVRPSTLVWREGAADWVAFSTTGLADRPPPPPPALAPVENRLRLSSPPAETPPPDAVAAAPRPPESVQRFRSASAVPGDRDPKFRFDGAGRELFSLYLKNILLTVVTLGVYRFWAAVANRRFQYQHTAFYGGRFDYHATGREKLIGFLKGLVLLLPIGGASAWVFWREVQEGDPMAATLALYTVVLLVGLFRPMILVGSNRFNLSRTSWNGLRFRFVGTIGAAYKLYIRDILFTVLTLGTYWAWHQVNVRRFRAHHSGLGESRFEYTGAGGSLFSLNLGGYLLTLVTFGIYAPWWAANVHNYHLNNTRFAGAQLRSSLTGGDLLLFGFVSVLLVVFTLGFALPWVVVNYRRLLADRLFLEGAIPVHELRAILDSGGSALADGVSEAGEALDAIGDVFT